MRKSITVLGKEYAIEFKPFVDMENRLGIFDSEKQVITIANHLNEDGKQSTLTHEVIEGINAMLELRLPHKTIMALEAGLHSAGVRW